jgi:trehalose 6-phosphate phosphatase
MVTEGSAPAETIARLIEPLRSHPASSAILCDVDGTLAPIVDDPDCATVPDDAREVLAELARRYALVACVSGRAALAARDLVGLAELTYAGNHGLEVLRPGAREAIATVTGQEGRAARDLVLELDPGELESRGLRLEDKGPIQGFHWRQAGDPESAERLAREIASAAERDGLEPHWGRKVLELRPALGVHKGTAVKRLLSEQGIERALFGGDDRTDLDAFCALRALVARGALRAAVCLGIDSPEAPPELADLADVVVGDPGDFLEVLGTLARTSTENGGEGA